VIAGIRAAEADKRGPTSFAFNLHRVLRDGRVSSGGREQVYTALLNAGFSDDQVAEYRSKEQRGVIPMHGAEAVRAFGAVFDVAPAAAVTAGAWGEFQVMGKEGGFLDLARQAATKEGDAPLTDDQAAHVAVEMFKAMPKTTGQALFVNWWDRSPKAREALKKFQETGDVNLLAVAYHGVLPPTSRCGNPRSSPTSSTLWDGAWRAPGSSPCSPAAT